MAWWWWVDVGQCFYPSASVEKQEFQTKTGLSFYPVPWSHFSIHCADVKLSSISTTVRPFRCNNFLFLWHFKCFAPPLPVFLHPHRPAGQTGYTVSWQLLCGWVSRCVCAQMQTWELYIIDKGAWTVPAASSCLRPLLLRWTSEMNVSYFPLCQDGRHTTSNSVFV